MTSAGNRIENGELPDVWMPFPIDPNSSNQVHYFQAEGRLKPGVTLEAANAQLQLTTQEFRRLYPRALSTSRGDVFSVRPLRDYLVKSVRGSLLTLTAAVGFVLLIACANVASLLLIRAEGRRREVAIRAAVGASRGRIVRQFLTESVLLSAAGATCGLAIGSAGIRLLLAMDAVNLPRLGEKGANVSLDWRVLVFTMLVAGVTGILFGLAPALQVSACQLELQPEGQWREDALAAGGGRDEPGDPAADWRGTVHPHVGGAALGESGVRPAPRSRHASYSCRLHSPTTCSGGWIRSLVWREWR